MKKITHKIVCVTKYDSNSLFIKSIEATMDVYAATGWEVINVNFTGLNDKYACIFMRMNEEQ